MDTAIAQENIKLLAERGQDFTFESFATKSVNGFPNALTPDWVSWTTRVKGAISALFGPQAAPSQLLKSASEISLIGWDKDHFDHAKAHYTGALSAASEILDNDTFGELLNRRAAVAPRDLTNKVFIVHGHDESSKNELEIMLRDMGLDPVVLHRQIDGGRTIIEKFEHHADVGYAFILMTPDEVAYLASDEQKPDADRNKEARARPNVIWEFGYFVGRLGRERTCCIHKGSVSVPSDLNGLVYKRYDRSVEEIGWAIQKELRSVGYKLKT